MSKKTWRDELNKLFEVLAADTQGLSEYEREVAYSELITSVNTDLAALRTFQAEVEYGQHIEGMYDINPGKFINRAYGRKF